MWNDAANAQSVESDPKDPGDTAVLLRRLQLGDDDALRALLSAHLEWIRDYVHRSLGGVVRRTHDTGDVVSDVMVRVLRRGPRFQLASRSQFRRLMATIVKRELARQARRNSHRSRPTSSIVLDLDTGLSAHGALPGDVAAHEEDRQWVRLALQLLPGQDQDLIEMHGDERLAFPEIGRRLGTTADAARKRHDRAVVRLHATLLDLRAGRLERVLADGEAGPARDEPA
jgi:RNA polymerase sigma factor (sigma-70 family)